MARAFLAQSFWIPQPPLTEKNLPDQAGKVFIVTGGYSGIGFELCKILFRHNGTVYIAGRNEAMGKDALRALETEYPNSRGKIRFLHLDLGDLSTIRKSAEAFMAQEERLDVLTNNAGVYHKQKVETSQGYEIHLGTNCLGPFLFTYYLMELLRKTASISQPGMVRVTWAASIIVDTTSPWHGMSFQATGEPKTSHDQRLNYSLSKVGNIFLARELARQLSANGVVSIAFNPGNLNTNMLKKNLSTFQAALFNWTLYTPIHGAYTELFAACSSDIGLGDNGNYIIPWGRISSIRRDIEEACRPESSGGKGQAHKFWEWCLRETAEFL